MLVPYEEGLYFRCRKFLQLVELHFYAWASGKRKLISDFAHGPKGSVGAERKYVACLFRHNYVQEKRFHEFLALFHGRSSTQCHT